jgi:hypothetical protein
MGKEPNTNEIKKFKKKTHEKNKRRKLNQIHNANPI